MDSTIELQPGKHLSWQDRASPDRIDPAFVHFKRFQESVGIELTMRCPLKCAHCSYDSGPERTELIDEQSIIPFVTDACTQGGARLLIVSGGEPFLEAQQLNRISRVAANAGAAVAVNTSAYWAKSVRKGVNFLAQFPHISHLNISVDQYHEEFIPLTHARNAVEAALDLDKVVTLMVRVWDTRNDPYLDIIENTFGASLLDSIAVDLQQICADGRGKDLPGTEAALTMHESAFPEGRCELANQQIVNTCGTVVACCNHNIAMKHPVLQAGNINHDSHATIADRANRNRVLHAIRTWGPAGIARRLIDAGLGGQLKGLYEKNNICSLCEDIVSQPDLLEALNELLAGQLTYSELYLGRLLQYGEFFPDGIEAPGEDK